MIRRKSSPARMCLGLLIVFFALAFLLPAVREGGDPRLWVLAAAVPGALLLFGLPFVPRLLSLDRVLSVLALTLCAAGILALARESADEAVAQALRCAGAVAFLVVGSWVLRVLRPSLMTALVSGGVTLVLFAVPLLADSVSLPEPDIFLPLLLIAFVSLLSIRSQLPAMLLALMGMTLLLARGNPVTALIWGITFLLLFWSWSGHPVILLSGIAAVCVLVSGARFLFPGLFSAAGGTSAFAGMNPGLFGPGTADDPLIGEAGLPSALFPLFAGRYGWILSACVLMLYPSVMFRGVSLARSARSRFHGMIAMGAVIMIMLNASAGLLFDAGFISVQQVCLPGLSRDFASLGSFLFLVGMLGFISSRGQADLEEDAHLAMLAG